MDDRLIEIEEIKESRQFIEDDYKYIQTEQEVYGMVDELKNSEIIGVDLEHHQLRSY